MAEVEDNVSVVVADRIRRAPTRANAANVNMIGNPDAENIGLPMLTSDRSQILFEMVKRHTKQA